MSKTSNGQPFLTDVQELRKRARVSLDKGAITPAYHGDVKQTIDILQAVLATEIVCVLRYTMNAITAAGISSDSVKKEFEQHAKEEQGHMRMVAERINQLGGTPNFNPEGLATRSASQYSEGGNLIEMIKENLVAERIACEHYRELIRFFADKDSTTRVMMKASWLMKRSTPTTCMTFWSRMKGSPCSRRTRKHAETGHANRWPVPRAVGQAIGLRGLPVSVVTAVGNPRGDRG